MTIFRYCELSDILMFNKKISAPSVSLGCGLPGAYYPRTPPAVPVSLGGFRGSGDSGVFFGAGVGVGSAAGASFGLSGFPSFAMAAGIEWPETRAIVAIAVTNLNLKFFIAFLSFFRPHHHKNGKRRLFAEKKNLSRRRTNSRQNFAVY